ALLSSPHPLSPPLVPYTTLFRSETRVGKVMATRRKQVFLATKIPDRGRDDFLRRLEGSLKRLETDHVDLVHIHSLGHADDQVNRSEEHTSELQSLRHLVCRLLLE